MLCSSQKLLLFALTLIGGVWSTEEDCTVPIPFLVDKKCDKVVKQYTHVDIAVYIEVTYIVPMEEKCWKCVTDNINPQCGTMMQWHIKGQCYWYTEMQCDKECKHSTSRFNRLVKQNPTFPPPPKLPLPSSSSMRQRFRSKEKKGSKGKKGFLCITEENNSLILKSCQDTLLGQQFSLYPVEDEFLILYTPKKSLTKCERRRNEDYFKCNVPGCMITQCDDNGMFIPKQCHLSIGYTGTCWCVNKEGKEIVNTRTEPGDEPPVCPPKVTGRKLLQKNPNNPTNAPPHNPHNPNNPNNPNNPKKKKNPPKKNPPKKKKNPPKKKKKENKKNPPKKKKNLELCNFSMTSHKQWSKNIVACENSRDTCQVYEKLNQEFGGSCQDFCEGFNLVCKNAWKDLSDYTCEKGDQINCTDTDGYTSDHICECGVPDCDCEECIPVPQNFEVQSCVEEIEVPEFHNTALTEWSLGMISKACQVCVHKADHTCRTDPWVPSGNHCVHYAHSKCKKACSNDLAFPKSTVNPLNNNLCLSSLGMLDVCGPETAMQIIRLPSGAVKIKKGNQCLSTLEEDKVSFTPCSKKSEEWFLETII